MFSAGFGSKHGAGYVVQMQTATLARIPDAVKEEILDDAARWLAAELPKAFPGTELSVSRDGPVLKIHGDLALED